LRSADGTEPFRRKAERLYTAQDGTRLFYADYGDPRDERPTLLCLPGLARTGADFDDVVKRFRRYYRILCPDYRGRGRSQRCADWRRYHPHVLLDDLRHLMAIAGAHRVVVVGTSMGGLLAMGLSVMMPGAIAGIVMNDIGPFAPTSATASLLAEIGADHPQPDWPAAERYLKERFPDLPAYDEPGWRRIAERTFQRGEDGLLHITWDPAVVKPVLAMMNQESTLGDLFRGIAAVPLMTVRGARSTILDAAGLSAMLKIRPDMMHVTVPNVGHAPSLDEDVVVEQLNDFFARCA